ncbi:MAG: N-acetylneuraminate synthase family protein [Cyanobacteria bacterium J06592_8]
MRIEKKIKNYLVFSGDSIWDSLKRINDNHSRIVFVVEDNGLLIGAVSDGDFRRWITSHPKFDLNQPVDLVMNPNFISMSVHDAPSTIAQYFAHDKDIIPLTDEVGRFVALARKSATGFQIGEHLISEQGKSFIIAEVGNNHNGDITLAKKLVDLAVKAGADCVKFQMRDLKSLYSNKGKTAKADYDLGSQYTLDVLNKFQLTREELFEVFDYSYHKGILPLCTPWDLVSVDVLNDYGIEAFKVASADFTNFEILEALTETGKSLICSTGMCAESEIKASVSLLKKLGAQFALLHCNSTYPTPFKDVNLLYLSRLKKISGTIVGYSGHERGFSVPVAAVALGARIIEKHFTVDRSMEGSDHKVSLLPDEFAQMVRHIKEVEDAMGQEKEREITQGELINRENLAKSLIINQPLEKGKIINREMIEVKSPGQGLQPNRINELVGKIANRDFVAGDFFFESDIVQKVVKKRQYSFSRPYGIPARYHDYHQLTKDIDLDFIEFHLSYHDLELSIDEYFPTPQTIGLAVHSPELFAGDHIMDLASRDAAYVDRSIEELERVISITNNLKHFFPTKDKPVLVINAGGWTPKGFIPIKDRKALYLQVEKTLEQINLFSVQLAIQTMPPFPWHFGGQSHHNLFVDPDEISEFCRQTGHKICLDVSHSMMACNYYKWDFSEFLEKVLPYTVHLHIVDAKGVDGEGIQIGNGDVDFKVLKYQLDLLAPQVQFIPEVWQGHKNKGEGFWSALEFLEKIGI